MPGADPLKASLTLVVLSVTGNQDEDNMTDAIPTHKIALFVPPSICEVFFTQFNNTHTQVKKLKNNFDDDIDNDNNNISYHSLLDEHACKKRKF